MKILRQIWYRVEAAVVKGLLGVLNGLPPSVVTGLTRLAGRAIFLVWGARRRIAVDNLLKAGVAKTPAEARRIAAAAFENFALIIPETLILRRRLTPENWRRYIELKVTPEVDRFLNDPGQGAIAASAHLGNWEVAAQGVSLIKPLYVVYRPFKNPELDRVIRAGRTGDRLQLVSRLERDPLRFLQALKRNEFVAMMMDQHVVDGRVQVEFFGRSAWTTKAPALLHFTTRAPLILACALRTGHLKFEIHAVGPFHAQRTGDRERDVLAITQVLTREIETMVRAHPEQYLWGHRRWKP